MNAMRTIKLIIEYDGGSYAGWQVQPNGLSIQEVVETALATLTGEFTRLRSSGRTDAGVHAKGMAAAFETTRDIPVRAFSDGLNSLLPADIAVREACEVEPGFDPRREARGKLYRYTIYNALRRSPLVRHVTWHVRDRLDLGAMRTAANLFVGEHDYAAFRTSGCAAKTTVRRIHSVAVESDGDFITIDVSGTGFLKNMVRIMVGTLVNVGRGKSGPELVSRLLAEPGSAAAGATAPSRGLCLVEVYY
jgi:tRNA pseudouridine38-40 synthase